jgi:hypothetical protein
VDLVAEGSKEGLIAALGAHAFDLLRRGLDDLARRPTIPAPTSSRRG